MVGLDPLSSTLLESSQLPQKLEHHHQELALDIQRLAIGSLYG
jgi:hypothetical protein